MTQDRTNPPGVGRRGRQRDTERRADFPITFPLAGTHVVTFGEGYSVTSSSPTTGTHSDDIGTPDLPSS